MRRPHCSFVLLFWVPELMPNSFSCLYIYRFYLDILSPIRCLAYSLYTYMITPPCPLKAVEVQRLLQDNADSDTLQNLCWQLEEQPEFPIKTHGYFPPVRVMYYFYCKLLAHWLCGACFWKSEKSNLIRLCKTGAYDKFSAGEQRMSGQAYSRLKTFFVVHYKLEWLAKYKDSD